MRKPFSVIQRMYLGFGAVLLILLLLVGFAYFSFVRLGVANASNLHTHRVLEEAQSLQTAVVSMQTGYRGFMLAGAAEFLAPLREGSAGFQRHHGRLEELIRQSPEQQRRLARARQLQREWMRVHIEPGLAMRRRISADTVSLQELLSLANTQRGRMYAETISALVAEVAASEARMRESRASRVARLQRLTTVLLLVGGVFGVLLTLILATLAARSSARLLTSNRHLEREIQERRRAEEELERVSRRNELILHAAGGGIYGLDRDGNTSFANPAAVRMTGFAVEEMLGRPNHALVHHSHPDGSPYARETCPIHSSLHDGLVHSVNTDVFWRKDGSSFPVEYIATPIWEDGQITGAVVTFRDITERREVERMKDEFVSVVSHELRTPLTSIRGSLGLLASGRLGTLPERGQRLLEIATHNTDRLVRLINDILDIERIESGRVGMERTPCDSGRLMRQAAEVVQGFAQRERIQLELEPVSLPVWADADRIVQVLTNLLSNAIKFSAPGERVWLRARPVPGQVVFEVQDQGRGIPPDKLESIFGRFQQVDASDSREKGGTGLGLAIARSIVQQHGGQIEVRSTPGEGSVFCFTVPRAGALDRASEHPRHPRGPLVLVCDDDPSVREVVSAQLEQHGYRVAAADSGEAAIRRCLEQRTDAILLDLMMPGMDGWETMIRLKEHPQTRDVPIIILSALAPQRGAAERAGAVDWVEKATEERSLFEALDEALSRTSRVGHVLLVEDDADLAEVLMAMFQRNGVTAAHVQSCSEAVELARDEPFDLVVLDLVLKQGSGFDVVDCLRRHDRLRRVPLVVYSALDLSDEDRTRLRLGRTEFFTKGRVSPEEFERSVLALLRKIVSLPETRVDDAANSDR